MIICRKDAKGAKSFPFEKVPSPRKVEKARVRGLSNPLISPALTPALSPGGIGGNKIFFAPMRRSLLVQRFHRVASGWVDGVEGVDLRMRRARVDRSFTHQLRRPHPGRARGVELLDDIG